MNKKGEEFLMKEVIAMLFRYFIVALVLIIIGFFVYSFLDRDIREGSLPSLTIHSRLLTSADCFAFEEQGRVYTGIIDTKKLDEEILKNCLENHDISFLVNITYLNGTQIKTFSVDHAGLLNKIEFCDIKNKNFRCDFLKEYVLLKDSQTTGGIFKIAVLTKNE